MKTRVLVAILTMLLGVSLLSAASTSPGWSYGFELGVSKGDNADSSDENFGPLGRGFFQFEHIPQLITRIGLGYTQLKAPGIYSTQTMMGDARFLVRPIQFDKFSPFLYAGIGASKELKDNRADIIPMFPAGVGFQTRLSQRMTLELSGGYYLILSDDLDGVERADNDLNRYTDRKHDGFFSLTAGLFFNEKPQTPVKREPAPSVNLKDMDTDGDGLSDYDEIYVYKTDPKKADTDGDGLNDYVEVMQYKTDPRKADTDGDGLSDYAEVMTHKTDPLKVDTDGDGLSDYHEIMQFKTDPLKADTDGDGLSDYAEIIQYKTNPLNPDTDGGGMKDGEEVQKNMNPLLAGDDKPAPVIEKAPPPPPPPVVEKPVVPVIEKAPDTDGDGLSDKDEIEKYGTDPNKKDTDGDGLSDYDEVMKYMTNPLKVDTDGDGLSDYAEVMTHKTNPLVMDTDKGTVDDGTEVAAGTDPLDPKDDILDLHVGTKFSLDGIFFDTAKATIKAESIPVLEKAFAALNANPDVKVVIIGHTDNVGSASSNQTLSQNRANAVKDWLVAKGIAATRIRAIGKGEAEPRATNDTDAGRTLNRRIEFEVEN